MKKPFRFLAYPQVLATFAAKAKRPMWKEKLGNYLIDVSKYVLTGVVISSLFKYFCVSKILIYIIGIITLVLALLVGFILTNKTDKKKEEK